MTRAERTAEGEVHVDWVPLSAELPTSVDVVFTAAGIEDLGERDIDDGHDDVGSDLPRLARFTGVSALATSRSSPTAHRGGARPSPTTPGPTAVG